jgi:hypothetical protein
MLTLFGMGSGNWFFFGNHRGGYVFFRKKAIGEGAVAQRT